MRLILNELLSILFFCTFNVPLLFLVVYFTYIVG